MSLACALIATLTGCLHGCSLLMWAGQTFIEMSGMLSAMHS